MLTETDDQRSLRAAVRDFLSRRTERGCRDALREAPGYAVDVWRAMSDELGILGLGVEEDRGGSGGTNAERAVLAEELGRQLVPTPFLSSSVIGLELAAAASDAHAADLVRALADGRRTASVAVGARPLANNLRARSSGGDWRITGTLDKALMGAEADVALVLASGEDGPGLFSVPLGGDQVRRTSLETIDAGRRIAELHFEDAPAVRLEADPIPAAERAYRIGAVLLAAEGIGVMTAVLEMTLAYVKDRHQFDRSIGSFQAVKHQCAEMAMLTEQAISVVRFAVDAIDSEDPGRAAEGEALATAFVGPACFQVARDGLHLHGGLGYTWEYDAHLYYRKAKSNEYLLGSPRAARRALAELSFRTPADAPTESVIGARP